MQEKKVDILELKKLESYLDDIFNTIGIDIKFSDHFSDRMNDPRNKKQITLGEIKDIFKSVYIKYKNLITKKKDEFQAVIKSLSTDINLPFVLVYDNKNDELDLIAKTVMRKPNFKTSNPVLKVNEMKKVVKISKNQLSEMVMKTLNLKEDDHLNPNDESEMSDSQMANIIKCATEIEELVKDGDQLDAWVQSLIAVAEFQLKTVKDYLSNEKPEDSNETE